MAVSVPNLTNGSWHDIVSTWDSSTATQEIYVNGALKHSRTARGLNAVQDNFCIGRTFNSEYFLGRIAYVRIYDYAWTQTNSPTAYPTSAPSNVPTPSPTPSPTIGKLISNEMNIKNEEFRCLRSEYIS